MAEPPRPEAGRSRSRWTAGLALGLTGLVALVVVLVLLLRDGTYVAEPPETPDAPTVPAGAAAATLERLADALRRGDGPAAAGLAVDGNGDQLAALAGNADELRLVDLSFRYVDEVLPLDDGRWTAAVEATWRLDGLDPGTARAEVDVRLQDSQGRVEVVGFRAPREPARLPVWLGGPVQAARGGETLVVAAQGIPLERYQRTARRAVPEVRRVLPEWSGPLVVEVPPDAAGVAAALGAEPSAYANVAAVTARVDGDETNPDAPVHVFVNPEVFADLGARGAQVVMTHEAVHVATGATSAGPSEDVPLWLREGFADYVALRDVDLPVRRAAAQVIEQVRENGLPGSLPGSDEFDAADDQFGAAYEAAWLANEVVADAAGQEALVGVYEDVSSGRDADAALRERAGFGVGELTERWRARLSELAGDGPA